MRVQPQMILLILIAGSVLLLIGGVTLLSLGIIGEYVGKIYMEAKHRPRYIIDTFVWKEDDGEDKTC